MRACPPKGNAYAASGNSAHNNPTTIARIENRIVMPTLYHRMCCSLTIYLVHCSYGLASPAPIHAHRRRHLDTCAHWRVFDTTATRRGTGSEPDGCLGRVQRVPVSGGYGRESKYYR